MNIPVVVCSLLACLVFGGRGCLLGGQRGKRLAKASLSPQQALAFMESKVYAIITPSEGKLTIREPLTSN